MDEIIATVRSEDIDGNSEEYFCCICLQLRLTFRDDKTRCYNCGSEDIIRGKPGSLDKAFLLKRYTPSQD